VRLAADHDKGDSVRKSYWYWYIAVAVALVLVAVYFSARGTTLPAVVLYPVSVAYVLLGFVAALLHKQKADADFKRKMAERELEREKRREL